MRWNGRMLVAAMCAGQVGNLLPHVAVPAVLAQHLIPLWGLSATEAGLMASAYAIGYMAAVPLLTTLTDRIDARVILLAGSAISALATIAFGLLADGFGAATLIWGLAGMGFAGAYMPGLRALTDRLDPGEMSRSVTLYTASFSVGVGLSFLMTQLVADAFGWRSAFLIGGAGPLVMIAVALRLSPFQPVRRKGRLLDFRPVLRNRPAMGYILGYGAHCFELYGMRTWIVGFWTFVVAQNAAASPPSAIAVSVLVTLLAMPASIVGNETAIRFGRHRAISAVMLVSAVVAILIGLNAGQSWQILLPLVLVYALTVPADSGALTAGMTQASDPASRGATMALHSTVGFGFSAAGSWGVGAALDAGGGPSTASGWLFGFAVLSLGILTGPVLLWWSRRSPGPSRGA